MYICIYIRVCVYIYVCVCNMYIYIYIYIYTCMCVFTYICVFVYIYIYVCVCVCVYMCPQCPPRLNQGGRGHFWFSKKILREVRVFFILREGESIWEDLPKQVVTEGFNFKKFNCILVLSFSQFCMIIKLYNTDCAFMSVLLYRSITFPKFEYDQKVIHVHNYFQYFDYDEYLT